jgi:hypothetical protein
MKQDQTRLDGTRARIITLLYLKIKMKKMVVLTLSLMLFAILVLSVPVVFAGCNNANGENGFQGTNKDSSQLPDQSSVPWPAGLVELILGLPNTPNVVERCRAD